MLQENVELNNGVKMPKIGFGTWQIENDVVVKPVLTALENGYIHLDSAYAYGNEKGVGEAVRNSGIPRETLFITTKIPAEVKTYEEAVAHIEASLKNLDLAYIDLMLIHAPKPWEEMAEGKHPYFEENRAVYRAMEEAYAAGKLKAIGVSNFDVADLENILEICQVTPTVNQIRYHIGHTQDEIVAFCEKHNIVIQAYSPIGTGKLLNNDNIKKVADKYGVSVAQICIKYVLQNNMIALPKSENPQRIAQNTQMDFTISIDDMNDLNQLKL